jgi:hypothetical protein
VVTSRSTRKLQTIKARYRRERPQPCMRCGQPIDYDADPTDPNSFTLGHIKSWAHHPELREDPGNLRQEHRLCNLSAGADDGEQLNTLGLTSRQW